MTGKVLSLDTLIQKSCLLNTIIFADTLVSVLFRCEAFSTYPRTYDLLHLDGLFSAESHR